MTTANFRFDMTDDLRFDMTRTVSSIWRYSLFEMRDSSPSCLRSKRQSFTVINKRGILHNSERKIISKRAVFLTLKRESFRSDKHGQKALKTSSSQKESPVYRKSLLSPFRTDYPPLEKFKSIYSYSCYRFAGFPGGNERYSHTFQLLIYKGEYIFAK